MNNPCNNTVMVGIDLVEIARISLKDTFVHYILTEDELTVFNEIRTENRKKEYLAGRFAAKEAIFKASQDREYLSYSILNKENGMPYVKDHPEMNISISHDGGMAVAVVMITG